MPKLIPEILEEIIENISIERCNINDNNNLEKFMLAGCQNFEAALNYFSQTKRIRICQSLIWITLKNNKEYWIPYNFLLLKPLVKGFTEVKSVEIYECPDVVYRNFILGNLINKKLKKISYFSEIFRPEYCCDTIKEYRSLGAPKVIPFPKFYIDLISPTIKNTVYLYDVHLDEDIYFRKIHFEFVERIYLNRNIDANSFDMNEIKEFAKFASKTFRNLKHLNAKFRSENYYDHGFELYPEFCNFEAEWLHSLPSHIEGKISFGISEVQKSEYDVHDQVINDGIMLIDEGVIRRKVQIYENFYFKAKIYFVEYSFE